MKCVVCMLILTVSHGDLMLDVSASIGRIVMEACSDILGIERRYIRWELQRGKNGLKPDSDRRSYR